MEDHKFAQMFAVACGHLGLGLAAFLLICGIATAGVEAQVALQSQSSQTAAVAAALPDDYGTGAIVPGTQYPAYCPQLLQTIQYGARDTTTVPQGQVTQLQHFISGYYNIDPSEIETGYFGSITQYFVIQFQKAEGLPPYGIVGSLTRAAIASTCGPIVTAGHLTVSLDASSPAYQIVAGGTTGVTLGVFDINPLGEGVTLQRVGLHLASGNFGDIGQAYIYSGTHLLGTATFTANSNYATSTLSSPVSIGTNMNLQVTVKADIGAIGKAQPGTAGDFVQVGITSAQGVGVNSGAVINATGSTNTAGVRMFESYPIVSLVPLSSTGLSDGRLLRFSVTAGASGSVGLAQIQVSISGLPANANGQVGLYAYTDAGYSSPIPGFTGGAINGLLLSSAVSGGILAFPKPVEIPAGTTYYFELRGNGGLISGATALATTLGGASGFAGMGTVAQLSGAQYVLWSPNDITTSQFTDNDWTNGYGVAGLPSIGITQTRTGGTAAPIPAPPSPIAAACPTNYLSGGVSCTLSHLLQSVSTVGLFATFNSWIRPGLAYSINFGDGAEMQVPNCTTPTTLANSCTTPGTVSHTYAKAGTYTVQILNYACVGSTTCSVLVDSASVTVVAPPAPPITANPINAACPTNMLTVQGTCSLTHLLQIAGTSNLTLTATFSSWIRPGLAYAINFGDGAEVQVPNCTGQLNGQPDSCTTPSLVSHTYSKAGTYPVEVLNYACVGSASCSVLIDSASVTVQ